MNLLDNFLKSSSFIPENGIFYQRGITRSNEFEKNYLTIREKEGRIYPDEIVRNLPDFPNLLPQREEWTARKITMMKLIGYLGKRNSSGPILELGCGNGWLAHHLAVSTDHEICGVDINERELLQGARLFNSCKDLIFVYGNIFTADIKTQAFGTIVLSSSIQYFPSVKLLINRLFELLQPSGEIHVVDSPLFRTKDGAREAKGRSDVYFTARGLPVMTESYFHHTLMDLKDFSHRILFNHRAPLTLLKRKILKMPQMVFPWVLIKQH
ncbi:MAG TPA: class I SAM-dependent methyltransferase [Cyclobacteriaceae bacterium]|nr:class I SAM-dependent methyltransferase [Cyclobacteriaceae bacterium]